MVGELLTKRVEFYSLLLIYIYQSFYTCFHNVPLAVSECLQTTTTRWRHGSIFHTGVATVTTVSPFNNCPLTNVALREKRRNTII